MAAKLLSLFKLSKDELAPFLLFNLYKNEINLYIQINFQNFGLFT